MTEERRISNKGKEGAEKERKEGRK